MNTALLNQLEQLTAKSGMSQYGWMNPQHLVFHKEVRDICANNGCGKYNTNWACPPAVGTLEECAAHCANYHHMLVFNFCYPLEDSFDFEGMMDAMHDFKKRIQHLHALIRPHLTEYLLFGNEGCTNCTSCTYPDAPCRFPDQMQPTLEGYGLIVQDLAKEAGISYHGGVNTVTYFGALLFNTVS